ncbi:MAG: selenium metabolism-associated LysR family transcriptional regulator [Deltaproteobacteria bacterium]|nr:selenium metabolism-associated LysR family transcriptional regulator [Deltaproteobacteria bacterium]
MDLKRMEVFCKIVELKSFTRAGEALSLAQPTVSEHIRSLETTLGQKLLDRFKGDVLPTPVGRVFYQYAKSIIQTRDEAFRAVDQFRNKLAGQLNLAASSIPGTYVLPKMIGSFKMAHPESQIVLQISDTTGAAEAVADGRAEAAIIGARWRHPKLDFHEIITDELLLITSPEHRWATQRGIIKPDELLEEPFVLREAGSGTRMLIKQVMEEHGLNIGRLNVVAELGSTEAVKQSVKDGMGVSVLSVLAVGEELRQGSLVAIEIRGIKFDRSLYLIQRKNRQPSPLCSAFISHLEAECKIGA